MAKKQGTKKPAAVKKMEGTYRPDRENQDAPEGTNSIPQPPKWLSKDARAAHKDMAQTLHNLGVLKHEDRFFLNTLCAEYAAYIDLVKFLNDWGQTYMQEGSMGTQTPKERPEAKLANTKSAFITKSLRELGLTPMAREKVSSSKEKEKPQDPLQEFNETRKAK